MNALRIAGERLGRIDLARPEVQEGGVQDQADVRGPKGHAPSPHCEHRVRFSARVVVVDARQEVVRRVTAGPGVLPSDLYGLVPEVKEAIGE